MTDSARAGIQKRVDNRRCARARYPSLTLSQRMDVEPTDPARVWFSSRNISAFVICCYFYRLNAA